VASLSSHHEAVDRETESHGLVGSVPRGDDGIMGTFLRWCSDFLREEDALSKTEYALLAALVVVILVTAYFTVGLAFVFTR